MLRAEADLSERDGIVIWNPSEGIPYQISGALQRLGSRLIALTPTDSQGFKNLPMQIWKWDSLNQSANPDFNSPFASAIISLGDDTSWALKIRDEILAKNPKTQFVWIIPQNQKLHPLQNWKPFFTSLQKTQNQATDNFFWTPPVFGFRDEFFMDRLIAEKNKRPGLFGLKEPAISLEILFSGDLASFVAGFFFAPKKTEALRSINHFWLPPLKLDWTDFLNHFKTAFGIENPGFLEKFASRIEAKSLAQVLGLDKSLSPLVSLEDLQKDLAPEHFVVNALDYFPSQLTPSSRALNHLARVYRKDPNLELVFPPGSTP